MQLCSITADGRKYPEKYWGKGRNLRVLVAVPVRKFTEVKISDELNYQTVVPDAESEAEKQDTALDTFSEPVGSSGDPKPLGTSSEPVGSGGSGGGGDPKVEKPRRTAFLFNFRGPKIPVN